MDLEKQNLENLQNPDTRESQNPKPNLEKQDSIFPDNLPRELGTKLMEYLKHTFHLLTDGEHIHEEVFIPKTNPEVSKFGVGIRMVSVTGDQKISIPQDSGEDLVYTTQFLASQKVFVAETYPATLEGAKLILITPGKGTDFEFHIVRQ
jgi:hypothetical protein